MDYKEMINIKKQRSFLLVSSALILLFLLAFPLVEWKDFSEELIHVIGKSPSEKYWI